MAATDRQVMAICLGAAFIFWLILNLSGDYDIRRTARVELLTSPDRTLSTDLENDLAQVEISGQGWDLIWQSLRAAEIPVSVDIGDKESFSFSSLDLEKQVARRLSSGDLTVSVIEYEPIKVYTSPKDNKRVPIVPRYRVTYAPGHSGVGPAALVPDSVTVIGPADALQDVNSWPTEEAVFAEVDESLRQSIPLVAPEAENLSLAQGSITLTQNVEAIIQRVVTVPVRVLNPPADGKYRLVPEAVDLSVTLPQSAYKALRPGDFRLVVDLAEMRGAAENNTVPLELVGKPEIVNGVYFSPRAVEFYVIN
ncbi:MAG: hypothetical protein AAFN92_12535 [Bacteroidota bacterium]